MNSQLKLIDINGTSSNIMDFSPSTQTWIYSIGTLIISYDLAKKKKTFITYHQSPLCLLQFAKNESSHIISIDTSSSPLITIWDIPSFKIIFSMNIKTRPNFHIGQVYIEQLKRDKYIIWITSIDCNLLYWFDTEIYEISFICNISQCESFVFGFKTFFNSNDFVIMLKDTVQYYRLGSNIRECSMVNNIPFPLLWVKNSLRVSRMVNIIAFWTERGNCLLYDQNSNSKPSITPLEQEVFTTCEFSGDSWMCGTNNGKIYCYNIYEYKLKFFVDKTTIVNIKNKLLFNQLQDNDDANSSNIKDASDSTQGPGILRLFVDESVDTIWIKYMDNSFLLSPISNIIKNTRNNFEFVSTGNWNTWYTFNHYDKITNIEPVSISAQNTEKTNTIFYTCSLDQSILSYNLQSNTKITNQYYDIERLQNPKNNNYVNTSNNKTYVHVIKFHPLFPNKLFGGDNKGSLYLFDTSENIFQYKKFIVGTFGIVDISFTFSGKYILIGFDTGMSVLCDLNRECEFCLRISEHFWAPSDNEKRKLNNNALFYSYWFNCDGDIWWYTKQPNEIEITEITTGSNNTHGNILYSNIENVIKLPGDYLDLVMHCSENYLICLLENMEIVVVNVYTNEITAAIDLNSQIDNAYNIAQDPSGLFLAIVCDIKGEKEVNVRNNTRKSSVVVFEIGTGQWQGYIKDIFPISKIRFDHRGMYMGIAGEKGDFSIWSLGKEMRGPMWNVINEMKENKLFWRNYEIQYTDANDNPIKYGGNINRDGFNREFEPGNNNDYNYKERTKDPRNPQIKNEAIQADHFSPPSNHNYQNSFLSHGENNRLNNVLNDIRSVHSGNWHNNALSQRTNKPVDKNIGIAELDHVSNRNNNYNLRVNTEENELKPPTENIFEQNLMNSHKHNQANLMESNKQQSNNSLKHNNHIPKQFNPNHYESFVNRQVKPFDNSSLNNNNKANTSYSKHNDNNKKRNIVPNNAEDDQIVTTLKNELNPKSSNPKKVIKPPQINTSKYNFGKYAPPWLPHSKSFLNQSNCGLNNTSNYEEVKQKHNLTNININSMTRNLNIDPNFSKPCPKGEVAIDSRKIQITPEIKYPNVLNNAIVKSSKNQQNSIRIKNIANAINEILTPEKEDIDKENIDKSDWDSNEDVYHVNPIINKNKNKIKNEFEPEISPAVHYQPGKELNNNWMFSKNTFADVIRSESNDYYINNRKETVVQNTNSNNNNITNKKYDLNDIQNKRYPEPDDIDDIITNSNLSLIRKELRNNEERIKELKSNLITNEYNTSSNNWNHGGDNNNNSNNNNLARGKAEQSSLFNNTTNNNAQVISITDDIDRMSEDIRKFEKIHIVK